MGKDCFFLAVKMTQAKKDPPEADLLMEIRGIEPLTYRLRTYRSTKLSYIPGCATNIFYLERIVKASSRFLRYPCF